MPASQIGDPQRLGLKLWVGDELMQDSNTARMIFSTAEQIAMLSSRVTLRPGDLILTGNTRRRRHAPRPLPAAGRRVRLWIEKIGELVHRVAAA